MLSSDFIKNLYWNFAIILFLPFFLGNKLKKFSESNERDRKKIHDKILTEMGLLQGEKYQWGKIVSEYDVRSNISSINIYYT